MAGAPDDPDDPAGDGRDPISGRRILFPKRRALLQAQLVAARAIEKAAAVAPPWPYVLPIRERMELTPGLWVTLIDKGDGTASVSAVTFLGGRPGESEQQQRLRHSTENQFLRLCHALAWERAGRALLERIHARALDQLADKTHRTRERERERQQRFDFVLSYLTVLLGLERPPQRYHKLLETFWDFDRPIESPSAANGSSGAGRQPSRCPEKNVRAELFKSFTMVQPAPARLPLADLPDFAEHTGSLAAYIVMRSTRDKISVHMYGQWLERRSADE
jgi:hypothetical protein